MMRTALLCSMLTARALSGCKPAADGPGASLSASDATLTRAMTRMAEEFYVAQETSYFRYKAKWQPLGEPGQPPPPPPDPEDEDPEERERRDADERKHAEAMERLEERYERHLQDLVDGDPRLVGVVLETGGSASQLIILKAGDVESLATSTTREPLPAGEVKTTPLQRGRTLCECGVRDLFNASDTHPEGWRVRVLLNPK